MKRIAQVKMIFISFFLILLTACGGNNDANEAQNTNNDNENKSAGVQQHKNSDNRTTAIKKANNGYITIEPSRTSTPSKHGAHTNNFPDGAKYRLIQKRIVVQPNGQQMNDQFMPSQPGRQLNRQAPPPPQTEMEPTRTQPQKQAPAKNNTNANTNQPATGASQFEAKVIELTNAQRSKNGLPALKTDSALSKVARAKSTDMQQKNYFSHTSPTYGSPFDMMKQFGVTYRTAGENIAKGQPSPEQVVNAWMNSAGHRKNILSKDFTHIGVGHTSNGNYWTQEFIGK
ncbi:CAP domain-containing protein [Ferdinandcohnia quinoae]|uniref:CAP domain-containing protein n=1 Tax=Fredinandcohnia quinoae TaxID=2918902 RepID=A0AAW5ECV4_9BACI|nr:CAP domain-containing protein [Fredinandcohnia sp. SECRCQ15]MCH1627281.1 CAP domain-containing protein [Fredinandcohnia sp. SECRCQ15]